MSTPIEEVSQSTDLDGPKKKPAKMRKRSSKKSSFLEGLLPDNINLTINMNDEDKEIVLNKMDEMKDELIYNWRIVQVLMFLGIMLGFIGSAL